MSELGQPPSASALCCAAVSLSLPVSPSLPVSHHTGAQTPTHTPTHNACADPDTQLRLQVQLQFHFHVHVPGQRPNHSRQAVPGDRSQSWNAMCYRPTRWPMWSTKQPSSLFGHLSADRCCQCQLLDRSLLLQAPGRAAILQRLSGSSRHASPLDALGRAQSMSTTPLSIAPRRINAGQACMRIVASTSTRAWGRGCAAPGLGVCTASLPRHALDGSTGYAAVSPSPSDPEGPGRGALRRPNKGCRGRAGQADLLQGTPQTPPDKGLAEPTLSCLPF